MVWRQFALKLHLTCGLMTSLWQKAALNAPCQFYCVLVQKTYPTVCICACHAALAVLSCICQVEDIVDTGCTLKSLISSLQQQGVASVKIVTLLNKQARRTVDIQADYVGIQVNRWSGCMVFHQLVGCTMHSMPAYMRPTCTQRYCHSMMM